MTLINSGKPTFQSHVNVQSGKQKKSMAKDVYSLTFFPGFICNDPSKKTEKKKKPP